jgi:hypothetical protein
VEPTTRGDPPSPRRWTGKGVRRRAEELRAQGHQVRPPGVGHLLHEADDSWHGARKTRAGGQHPDRQAPCEPSAARVRDVQQRHQPVISVDAQKKALIGDCTHVGREWHPQGPPPQGRGDDCIDPTLGQAIPDGVDAGHANLGWVSVGVDHDPPALAVATLRAWWRPMGSPMSPKARELLSTADSGGSHSTRARRWTLARPRGSDESDLRLCVSHLPTGTSQWHTIAHRLCCHITANWRGKPRESRAVVVSLSGDTNTAAGLRIQAALDAGPDPQGSKVREVEMKPLQIDRAQCPGEWNETILPHGDSQVHAKSIRTW